MNRVAALALVALLVGCAQSPDPRLTTALTNLANTAEADFQGAIAVANAATPPDTDAVPCAQAGIAVVTAMQKVLAATSGRPVGAFTALEIASLYQPGSAQTQWVVKTLETGCIAKLHDLLAAQQQAVGVFGIVSAVIAAAGV